MAVVYISRIGDLLPITCDNAGRVHEYRVYDNMRLVGRYSLLGRALAVSMQNNTKIIQNRFLIAHKVILIDLKLGTYVRDVSELI